MHLVMGTQLCNTDNDHTKEVVQLKALQSYFPARLIVIPSNFSDLTARARSYRENGAAVVCVDRLPPNWDGDTVTSNNVEGGRKATRFLSNTVTAQLPSLQGRYF